MGVLSFECPSNILGNLHSYSNSAFLHILTLDTDGELLCWYKLVYLFSLSNPCHVPGLITPISVAGGNAGRRSYKIVRTCGNHVGRVDIHKLGCDELEISKSLIASPSENEADFIEVNISLEERH